MYLPTQRPIDYDGSSRVSRRGAYAERIWTERTRDRALQRTVRGDTGGTAADSVRTGTGARHSLGAKRSRQPDVPTDAADASVDGGSDRDRARRIRLRACGHGVGAEHGRAHSGG